MHRKRPPNRPREASGTPAPTQATGPVTSDLRGVSIKIDDGVKHDDDASQYHGAVTATDQGAKVKIGARPALIWRPRLLVSLNEPIQKCAVSPLAQPCFLDSTSLPQIHPAGRLHLPHIPQQHQSLVLGSLWSIPCRVRYHPCPHTATTTADDPCAWHYPSAQTRPLRLLFRVCDAAHTVHTAILVTARFAMPSMPLAPTNLAAKSIHRRQKPQTHVNGSSSAHESDTDTQACRFTRNSTFFRRHVRSHIQRASRIPRPGHTCWHRARELRDLDLAAA